MHETPEDLSRLQHLLDESIERAGPFLRHSFEMPERSLSARQLVRHLQGIVTTAMATVTAQGEPRVAPIGAILYHGRFHVPTVSTAARTRHLRKRPAVSVSYYEGVDLAVIMHGRTAIVEQSNPEFAPVDAVLQETSEGSVLDWGGGEGLYLRVDPDVIYTFVRYPDRFPLPDRSGSA